MSAPPFASHLRRLALGAGEQMRAAARQAAAEARPWLRPENWTKERLEAAWAATRRKPSRALGYLGALVFLGFLVWRFLGGTGGVSSKNRPTRAVSST